MKVAYCGSPSGLTDAQRATLERVLGQLDVTTILLNVSQQSSDPATNAMLRARYPRVVDIAGNLRPALKAIHNNINVVIVPRRNDDPYATQKVVDAHNAGRLCVEISEDGVDFWSRGPKQTGEPVDGV